MDTQTLVADFVPQHNSEQMPRRIWGITEHARERFRERFGGELTPTLVAEWRQWIFQDQCKKFPGRDEFQMVCLCHWSDRNVEVPLVYDSWTDCIVTILRRGCFEVAA